MSRVVVSLAAPPDHTRNCAKLLRHHSEAQGILERHRGVLPPGVHFLTQLADRQRYIDTLRQSIRPGGHVIVATFASDGPEQCSGLDVMRYSPKSLQRAFGHGFDLIASASETHHTPWGAEQKFLYCYCRRS